MGTATPPQTGAIQQSPEAARKELKSLIDKQFAVYNSGTIAWSAVYNSCLIFALVFSAAAAIVAKLSFWKTTYGTDVAAICAGVSALLNALIVGGGFDRKWRANRAARSKIKQLLVDLADPTSDLPTIRAKFKAIVDEQDTAIMGHN